MAASRQLTAIMFTDVAGFTELAQADEKAALDLIAELDALVGPLLSMHHGRKVKAMGDGLLIEFPTRSTPYDVPSTSRPRCTNATHGENDPPFSYASVCIWEM